MDKVVLAAVWLFVFAIPLEDVMIIPGVGALGRVAGLLAFLAGVMGTIALQKPIRLHLVNWLMLLFVLWGGMSIAWSFDPENTLFRIWTYLQLLVMTWLVFQWASTEQDLQALFKAYVLGAYLSAFSTIGEYLAAGGAGTGRYAVQGFNPNNLAVILVLGIPLAWYVFQHAKPNTAWLYGLYPIVAATAVLLTASRNGLIALSISSLFLLLTLPRQSSRARWLLPVLGVVAVWLFLNFVPSASIERLSTTASEFAGGNVRFDIWRTGLELFVAHPLLGIGAGTFKVGIEQVFGIAIAPHNVYLAVLVEGGLVGFLLFVSILWVVVICAWNLVGQARLLWLNMVLVWGVSAGALNWEWRKQTWLLFILVAAHAACTSRFSAKESPKSGPETNDAIEIPFRLGPRPFFAPSQLSGPLQEPGRTVPENQ
jgi:O-antigen ligase